LREITSQHGPDSMERVSLKLSHVIIVSITCAIWASLFFKCESISDYLFLFVVITFLCSLVGLLVKIVLKHFRDKNEKEPFQFSLTRLLLATTAVAVVFGMMKIRFNFKETWEIVVASLLAFVAGSLTLIYKKGDMKRIILTVLWFFIFLFIFGCICIL
jgi:FtsH-binding integral membrane protein